MGVDVNAVVRFSSNLNEGQTAEREGSAGGGAALLRGELKRLD